MDSMQSTHSKARNPVIRLQKAAITSAMAFIQVVEWYLPQIEGLRLEGLVPAGRVASLKSPNNSETGLVLPYFIKILTL